MVEELESEKPQLILFKNDTPYNLIDGISNSWGISIIYQEETINLLGWGFFPDLDNPPDVVYLTVGLNNHPIEVAPVDILRADVAQSLANPNSAYSGWTFSIPARLLPQGETLLRVWGYDVETKQMAQLGNDLRVEVVKNAETLKQ